VAAQAEGGGGFALSGRQGQDAGTKCVPYSLSAGTDNKAFAAAGMRGYGFVPLRLPATFDFARMFHGVDERIPLTSLSFGVRTLSRFLTAC
jgi:acetylornithine deacetylase/succinyl-diaminopimelate desuccinylase-like protein